MLASATIGYDACIIICDVKASVAKECVMLYTIAVLFVIAWLVGLVGGYTMGGLIHILLVLAVVSVLLRVIQGRAV